MGVSTMLRGAAIAALLVVLVPVCCRAEIRESQIKDDARGMIMFEKFGFDNSGQVQINISGLSVKSDDGTDVTTDLDKMGFILLTEDQLISFSALVLQSEDLQQPTCVLQDTRIKMWCTLKDALDEQPNYSHLFHPEGANEYTLFFANCVSGTVVTMDVRTSMYNLEGSSLTLDYLPAGRTQLPKLFFSFFLIYVILGALWGYVCVKQRSTVHRIHILMGILIFLKALNLLSEAEEKLYIKRTGRPHGWDIAFYIFGFLRGVMLFTVIVLIGTGWSFLKPYLQEREKKVLLIVIPLQVFANVASIVTDETGPSQKDWFTWNQVFLLLDIICCCAVLFPIVWSIKHLREASHSDGKAARNVVKLTLFRQYYIVLVSYIYFTRIIVFALKTVTDYRYRWTIDLAQELASLAFYVFTGYKFRPVEHNPYFVLDEEEEEAPIVDQLKDDEFDL